VTQGIRSRRPAGCEGVYTSELEQVSDAVAAVTGHPPTGLADYLRRNPDSYRHLSEAPGA
jgi:NAD(P)H dehydrogenase (quinone)